MSDIERVAAIIRAARAGDAEMRAKIKDPELLGHVDDDVDPLVLARHWLNEVEAINWPTGGYDGDPA